MNLSDQFDGYACISGELVNKSCAEMTDQELADFIEQGAWRRNAYRSDESADHEAARRGHASLRGGLLTQENYIRGCNQGA